MRGHLGGVDMLAPTLSGPRFLLFCSTISDVNLPFPRWIIAESTFQLRARGKGKNTPFSLNEMC